MKAGLLNMSLGVLIAVIGIVVTAGSYAAVSHSGGTYVVAWGAIAVGAWRFILGIVQVVRGAVAGQSNPSFAGLMPPIVGGDIAPPPPIAKATDAPAAVVVMGVLLIIQALVRAAFLTLLLLRVNAGLFEYTQFVIFSVTVPAILAVGGAIGGILAVQRSPISRSVCAIFCGVGLLFQLYGVFNIVNSASHGTFHMAWWVLLLVAANISVYVAGLIVFARWQPKPVGLN